MRYGMIIYIPRHDLIGMGSEQDGFMGSLDYERKFSPEIGISRHLKAKRILSTMPSSPPLAFLSLFS